MTLELTVKSGLKVVDFDLPSLLGALYEMVPILRVLFQVVTLAVLLFHFLEEVLGIKLPLIQVVVIGRLKLRLAVPVIVLEQHVIEVGCAESFQQREFPLGECAEF